MGMTDKAGREANLVAAAEGVPYLSATCDGKITYLAGPGADRYAVWAPYDGDGMAYEVTCGERAFGHRSTVKAAIALMVKVADKAYRGRLAR